MSTRHLFVYGTLRPGGPAHIGMLARAAVEVTPALLPDHALYAFGLRYPFVRPLPGSTVVGEAVALAPHLLMEVLEALDRYEGEEYERVTTGAVVAGGAVPVWVYRAADHLALPPAARVPSGDWWDRPESDA